MAERLSLGDDCGPWLASLEELGPPPDRMRLPTRNEAEALLPRLGFAADDIATILAQLPGPTDPVWRWLFERAYHGVLSDIGHLEAVRRTPTLPTHLGQPGRLFWIYVLLAAISDIQRWHKQTQIADEISWDTLSDFGRQVWLYRRRTGQTGLDTQWWLTLHFRGAIFALGRLQFNVQRLATGQAGPLFWYDDAGIAQLGAEFARGAPVLNVHVPEIGPLTPEACDASFAAAPAFFNAHFPEHSSTLAVCTSWLLDEQLAEYLPRDSNIMRFQRRFTLHPGVLQSDDSPFQFIFSKKANQADEIRPRTTLERALIDHIRQGRHWHLRTGWLRLGR